MTCIYCGSTVAKMANSHVISNFIRKRLTGMVGPKGSKTYQFRWFERPDMPEQDLPKPQLLCVEHDNRFGQVVESPAAIVLMPNPANFLTSATVPLGWHTVALPLADEIKSITVAEYRPSNKVDDDAILRFPVLTAWRALHALKSDGHPDVIAFLSTAEGKELNEKTVKFLDPEAKNVDIGYEYIAPIYLTGPQHACFLTGSDEDMPFAYAYLENDGQSCVAVLLGYWIIIWPLLPDGHPKRNFQAIRQMVFLHWHHHLREQYSQLREA